MKTATHLSFVMLSVVLSVSACSKDNSLSRGDAAKAIEEQLKTSGKLPTVKVQLGKAYLYVPKDDYRTDTVCLSLMNKGQTPGGFLPYATPRGEWRNWANAAEKEFITTTAQLYSYRSIGEPKTAIQCHFSLTDKAKPYLVGEERDGMVTLKVIDRAEVEVTGITKPSEALGSTVSEVEFTISYKFNPLGEALSSPIRDISGTEKNGESTKRGHAVFRLFDDGWRLAGGRGL